MMEQPRTWSFEQLTNCVPLSLGTTRRTQSEWPLKVLTEYLQQVS